MTSESSSNATQKLYRVRDVAKILQVTPYTVRDYLKTGKLTGFLMNGQWRITQEELTNFLEGKHG